MNLLNIMLYTNNLLFLYTIFGTVIFTIIPNILCIVFYMVQYFGTSLCTMPYDIQCVILCTISSILLYFAMCLALGTILYTTSCIILYTLKCTILSSILNSEVCTVLWKILCTILYSVPFIVLRIGMCTVLGIIKDKALYTKYILKCVI